MKKKIIFGMFLVFAILFLQFVSADIISNVQSSQFNPSQSKQLDQSQCQEGKDFLVQISPFGCTPAVVRTDLLEEQDVQVYCQLGATQINPLIDVQTIDSISFSGTYPNSVSGIGFHPAKAALGVKGDLNTPVLNNIGYVVINLKKQPNASAIPEFVEGNLTARIKYNIKNALGIGNAQLYVPELSQSDWETKRYSYNFWNGKGTLKAESVGTNNAQISVYSGEQRISSVNLQQGESSNMIYIPGLECSAGLKLKLDALENPDTRAVLRINAEVAEVAEGGKFLDNKCSVRNLEYRGINQNVNIRCIEDGQTNDFGLSINPKVVLNINGAEKEYSVGDWLYDMTTLTGESKSVYLAYIGTRGESRNVNDLFVYFVSMPQKKAQLTEDELHYASILVGDLKEAGQTSTGYIDVANDLISRFAGTLVGIGRAVDRGEDYFRVNFGDKNIILFEKTGITIMSVSIVNFAGATDIELVGEAKDYYEKAKADYETIRESYSSETYTKDTSSTFGEEAFYNQILLAWNANQKKTAYDLCQEYIQAYPNSRKDLSYCTDAIKLANQNAQEVYVTINGEVKTISFDGINEPTFSDYGATVRINAPDGTVRSFNLRKNAIVYLDRNQEVYAILGGIGTTTTYSIYYKYSNGWSWSYDKITWGTQPGTNSETLLITQLIGKNLADGRTILMNQGARSETVVINDYLQLAAVGENSANIRTSLNVYGLSEAIAKEFTGGVISLQKDIPKDLGTGYVFTLTTINLKKVAKVSVLPNINNAGTEADFSFKIGIEKRAINLPPEQVRGLITTLNKTINDWEQISSNLGTITQNLQTGCLAAGAALVAKNFLLGIGGEGIARQTIMRGTGGWTEKCAQLVAQGNYATQDQCYIDNADEIDRDVTEVSNIIASQNNRIKQLESGITTTEFLTEKVVNTTAFMERYTPQVRTCLGNKIYSDPTGRGTAITTDDLNSISYTLWKDNKYFNKEDLRDIELYCNILSSSTTSAELKEIANQRIYSELLDVKNNAGTFADRANLASSLGISSNDITFIETGRNARKFKYEGLINSGTGNRFSGEGITGNSPVAIVSTSDAQKYILLLDDTTGTQQLPIRAVYNILSGAQSLEIPADLKNIYFQRFDATTYQNEYKNAELRYYETEPYKGLPAIVPFDLKNGWYASTKQTLPTGGAIQPVDASARPNSFYLCNVGANGLEEFQTIGDDTCEMINLGTGMSYSQFPGLDERDAKTQIDKAVQAITQASQIYRSGLSGKVNILGNSVDVGSPAADIPQFQCQDFMSPNECLLLFNLCDPVICPSSRCDLGGAYPVKDVVQSGVIGSLVLCLPNVQEGIIFPVCLTGLKAGIDGFLSITQSYRDCLQESLNTGKVVGICDEIYSIYICDFFWRQTLPLTDIVIPKVVEFLFGQGTRGGGEYASVQSSWNSAESAISFFTNYYGANAKDAFLARTTETVKSEVCKSYTSAVVPTGADFINKITTPASPVQFTARFDEIPLTTATVPPTSHYKVFYHIFAGKDAGAYYQVYLRGSAESSYYQDASQNLAIASGYIAVGGYATETKDLTAVSGYNKLCVNVNGQEECGFKEISTDFAINYLKDQYVASQATEIDVTTEAECISGTASVYSILTSPNIQEGTEEAINPEIYNRGITRICATDNPGLGTDPYAGTENSRFVEVGYCDNENIKCWLDTESVKDVIKTTTVEGEALDDVSQNYIDVLRNEGNYLTEKEFSSSVQEIEKEKDSNKKITLVGNIFDRTFWSTEKVQLIFLRGNAYMELLKLIIGTQPKPQTTTITSTGNFTSIDDARQRVLATARALEGTIVSGRNTLLNGNRLWQAINYNCVTAVYFGIYLDAAGLEKSCVYSDKTGMQYTIKTSSAMRKTIVRGAITDVNAYKNAKTSARETRTVTLVSSVGPFIAQGSYCQTIPKAEKLDRLQPGDLIFYVWDENYDHMAIFIRWIDKANGIAELFDWNGALYKNGWGISLGEQDKKGKTCTTADEYYNKEKRATSFCAVYRYYQMDISDDGHPVYVYQSPRISGQQISTPKEETLVQSKDPPAELFASGYNPIQTTKTTVGDKIYSEAIKIADRSIYVSSAEFVSRSLLNAGISTLGVRSYENLVQGIESDKTNFVEIDINHMKAGDIILLGTRCDVDSDIGIFSEWDIANKRIIYYSHFGDRNMQNRLSTSDLNNVGATFYLYRAYRYVGDLTATEKNAIVKARARWTIQTALNRISPASPTSSIAPLTGNYEQNKQFINELIFDSLLNEQECKDVRGGLFGWGQKDINWVKTTLLSKQSGIQAQSTGGN